MEAKLYFMTILDLNYDTKCTYSRQSKDDVIGDAITIHKISQYLNKKGKACRLDDAAKRLVGALENAQTELEKDREKGIAIKAADQVTIDLPSNFIRELMPYQKKSVKHLTEVDHAANFSVPGSGKTTMVYAAYSILKNKGEVDKIVVIGPRSSFMPGEEEYEACFGERPNSLRVVGLQASDFRETVEDAELILLTYQMATNIHSELIKFLDGSNCLLVLDESHHVKRFEGGSWARMIIRISPHAKRRIILSGTPMPNSLLDLWSQFTFLWPFKNLLNESQSFKVLADSRVGREVIKQQVKPFFCRVTKSELGLPNPSFKQISIPLMPIQQAIYNKLKERILEELQEAPQDKVKLREWRSAKMVRLLQAASNPALLAKGSEEFMIPPLNATGLPIVNLIENYTSHEIPSKLIKAVSLAKEIMRSEEKVIIWTTFVQNVRTLENMLKDARPIVIYGDIPKDASEDEFVNREKLIKQFKNDPNSLVLIATPNSCAESVSLHKICKNAIYVDRTFNAGQYIQSLDRIHRIGLNPSDKITYYLLTSKDTIDEDVNDRLRDKYQRMLTLLDDELPILDLEAPVNELSDSDFDEDFKAVLLHLKSIREEGSDV